VGLIGGKDDFPIQKPIALGNVIDGVDQRGIPPRYQAQSRL